MERKYNLRPRVSGRAQSSNTNQYFRPQQHAPPAGVPPSSDVHSLRQALLFAEEHNMKLSSENATMRQQIADLQEGSRTLTHENRSLQRILGRKLHLAKQTISELETALKATKSDQNDSKKREETFRNYEKEISALEGSLEAQKEETERLRDFWAKELDRRSAAFESELTMVKAVCDTQRSSDLQQMQGECQMKMSQLQEQVSEQDREICTLRDEVKTRSEEQNIVSSQLVLKQTELDQSVNKCNALEEELKKQLAEREESWERTQKEMEKLWQEKEEALKKKASEAEEELKLVIIKNIHLQELALQKQRKKNKKRRGFWSKKKPEIEEEEASVCSAQAGQEEGGKERKEKKRGFWSWTRRRNSSHSDRVEEGAACPAQDGQQ